MTRSELITYIQRDLEDTNELVWSEAHISEVIDQIIEDFSRRTQVVEDAIIIKYPFQYRYAVTQEWEKSLVSDETCLLIGKTKTHPRKATCLYAWELDLGDADHIASYVGTQPFEFIDYATHQVARCELPRNLVKVIMLYYNEEIIYSTPSKRLLEEDWSWSGRVGVVECYTPDIYSPGGFALYKASEDEGRWNTNSRRGILRYIESSSYTYTMTATGGILRSISGDLAYDIAGVAFQTDELLGTLRHWGDPVNNIELVYSRIAVGLEMPSWMHKFLAFGVLNLLFRENTEGKNSTKASHFDARYNDSVELVREIIRRAKGDVTETFGNPKTIQVLGSGA